MWGGVKKRTHYGDIFKHWSASRGLEELRIKLYKEPRPWYVAYSLHQSNHLLQDHHCARLLAWSASIVELRPSLAGKQDAYRYAHEIFQLMMRHHKVGAETLNEFMRLCAVGADLTSAFKWCKYWREAQLEGGEALSTLTWLLVVARVAPSDERAEDIALTVLDLYQAHFADAADGSNFTSAAQPTSTAEDQRRFQSCFKALEPRLRQNARLRDFLDSLPLSHAAAEANCAAFGWPAESPHRLFPQLELHQHLSSSTRDTRAPFTSSPRLRDSLLHPDLVAQLEAAADRRDVGAVVSLVESYERKIAKEKAKMSSGRTTSALSKHSREDTLWRAHGDATALAYSRPLVQEGGVTPELYHYLITALATVQPSAALTTLAQMEEASLRPLDLTRAAVLIAVRDSAADQRRLFQQQLDAIDTRRQLDADNETVTVAEAYWKYDYVGFFHYRNALTTAEFYLYLMVHMGTRGVQQLLLDVQRHGPVASAEDLVVLDENLRNASCLFHRAQIGRTAVQAALDAISHEQPKLDISLVGTVPHFENYYMEAMDDIALSERALQTLLQPYDVIYVLDTSFIETSESFLSVGAKDFGGAKTVGSGSSHSLVLVPYLSLAQLGASVSSANTFTSFDPALQQAISEEPFLASQRLRALFAMIASSSSSSPPGARHSRRTRLLHFTECLCAHQVEPSVLDTLGLSPATNDNHQLLLVLAMLSCLKPSTSRLVLCTDDTQLVETLLSLQHGGPLFGSVVEVVGTAPPPNLDLEHNLIDDNPIWRDGQREDEKGESFVPGLEIAAVMPEAVPKGEEDKAEGKLSPHGNGSNASTFASPQAVQGGERDAVVAATEGPMDSPWLALLDEDGAGDVNTTATLTDAPESSAGAVATTTPVPVSLSAASPSTDQELRDRLMSLYETPFDVVPIGVRMEEASALGSVFAEFDSMDPEQRDAMAADKAAASSRLASAEGSSAGSQPQRRRRSALEREMLTNRGFSNKGRLQLARKLSNQSGGRVPFNMRYRVVEANVRDPRNAHLRKVYEASVEKKRSIFKRRHE